MKQFIRNFSDKKDYLAIIIITSVAILIYLNSLGVPLLFDDAHMIAKNNYIKDVNNWPLLFTSGKVTSVAIQKGMYRPVLMLTFVFNYFFGRLNTIGYHIINIMLHFLNGILLFLLLRSFLNKSSFWPAFLTSLLFIVHPINSEAVIYISCRSTLLSSFFFLLGIFTYSKANLRVYDKKYYLVLVAFILGLLTKETMIVFPFFLFAYDILFRRDRFKNIYAFIRPYLIFILPALFYISLRQYMFGATANIIMLRSFYSNILTQANVSVFYFKLFFWPVNLCIGRHFPTSASLLDPSVLQSLLVIVSLIAVAAASFKKLPLLSFSILWYFVNLIPKFIATLNLLATEHHLYLPAVGIFIAIAIFIKASLYILDKGKHRVGKGIGISMFIILFTLFSILTVKQQSVWKDDYSLWLNTIKYSPSSLPAYNNLGLAARNQGRPDEAESYFLKALKGVEESATPGQYKLLERYVHINLSGLYLKRGQLDLAEKELMKAMAICANDARLYNNLGLLFSKQGLKEKEIRYFKRAIELNPNLTVAYLNLGISYYSQGKPELAIETLKAAIETNPDHPTPYMALSCIYEKSGSSRQAVYFKSKALDLSAADANDYYNLGIRYGKLGDRKAVDAFKQAIRLNPKFAAAHNNLAITYAHLEPPKIDLARRHAKLALKYGYEVNPDFLKQLGISEK